MMIIPIYLGNIGEAVRFVNNINTFEYESEYIAAKNKIMLSYNVVSFVNI